MSDLRLLLALTLGSVLALSACKGGVSHPDAGNANSSKYCADRKDSENNCSACSSQPGCGFCDTPQSGQAHCQPGTSAQVPGTCEQGWAISTEDCEKPPPPPPPPEATASSAEEPHGEAIQSAVE